MVTQEPSFDYASFCEKLGVSWNQLRPLTKDLPFKQFVNFAANSDLRCVDPLLILSSLQLLSLRSLGMGLEHALCVCQCIYVNMYGLPYDEGGMGRTLGV
jgi:hypothetical protein